LTCNIFFKQEFDNPKSHDLENTKSTLEALKKGDGILDRQRPWSRVWVFEEK